MEHARVDKNLEMVRDGGLGKAEWLRQVAHARFRAGLRCHHREQSEPRRVSDSFQGLRQYCRAFCIHGAARHGSAAGSHVREGRGLGDGHVNSLPRALTCVDVSDHSGDMTHLLAIGGSDAGIAAALRARELDPSADVTVMLADSYPNYSICGIPYWISGDVAAESDLAHRTGSDLEAAGIRLLTDTRAVAIDVDGRRVETVHAASGASSHVSYDEVLIGTGAHPVRPDGIPVGEPGVLPLHAMADAEAVHEAVAALAAGARVAVIGAGYIGLEMCEALIARGLDVTLVQRGPEVLSTLDPELGALITGEARAHGVAVATGTTVTSLTPDRGGTWLVHASGPDSSTNLLDAPFSLVIVCLGVAPSTELAVSAGAELGSHGAVAVDDRMRTGVPHVWAAGDCVVTHHRLLGLTWLPLGTTAHKQGRVAGENMLGGDRRYAGSVGTQVVKVFDLVAARTGLRDRDAADLPGTTPLSSITIADDHKAYYPGAVPLSIGVTGDTATGRLLGAQIVGHRSAEVAKRIDVFAAALHAGSTLDEVSDLDLSYTPPLGSPWDAVQVAAQAWERERRERA